MDEHIGAFDYLLGSERDETDVARSGSDEIASSWAFHDEIGWVRWIDAENMVDSASIDIIHRTGSGWPSTGSI
jgi:hypothetical protein